MTTFDTLTFFLNLTINKLHCVRVNKLVLMGTHKSTKVTNYFRTCTLCTFAFSTLLLTVFEEVLGTPDTIIANQKLKITVKIMKKIEP